MAVGQELAQSTSETVQMPEFTVSTTSPNKYNARDAISVSRIDEDILNTPSSISVVTRAVLDDVDPTRLFDTLRYLPGVSEGSSAHIGDRDTLRGFAATFRFVDGIQLSGSENVDPVIVQRVEVLNGPNAVLAPTGLAGGTVNIVTKSPQYEPAGSLSTTIGNFDAQRIDLDITGPCVEKSGFAYRVIASYQDSPQWVDNTKLKQTIIFPSLSYHFFQTTIVFKINYTEWHSTWEGTAPINPTASPTEYAQLLTGTPYLTLFSGNPNLYRTYRYTDYDVLVRTKFNPHVAMRLYALYETMAGRDDTLSINAPLGGAVNPYTGLFTPGVAYAATAPYAPITATPFDPTAMPMSGNSGAVWSFNTTVQNDFVAVFNLPFGIKSTTIAGWQFDETKGRAITHPLTSNPINAYNPVMTGLVWGPNFTTNNPTNARALRGFGMERITLFGDRLWIDAGMQARANRGNSTNVLTGTTTFNRGNTTSPMASVLVKPLPNVSVYADHSENGQPVSTGLAASPVVNQLGKQNEFGVKSVFFDERVGLTAAIYNIKLTNYQLNNPAHNIDPTAPNYILSDEKCHGYEFGVTGAITSNLSVIASYSYDHARDAFNRRTRCVPDYTSSALLDYSWNSGLLKGLSANAGISHEGSRAGETASGFTALGVPIFPSYYLAPYTILNMGASYAHQNYILRVFVGNPLNDHYIVTSGARNGSQVGAPINLRVQTTIKF